MRLIWREAVVAFRRSPMLSALSVAAIAFSLLTTGLYGLVALNFRGALEDLASRVEVVAFVLRGTPPETITRRARVPSVPSRRTVGRQGHAARAHRAR